MKIAFVGKGGSGKTSHAALFTHYLLHSGYAVFALDGDINMHLPSFFGVDAMAHPHLAHVSHAEQIKKFLRGTNERIRSEAEMKKTTPPGRGSRLLSWQLLDHPELRHLFSSPDPRMRLGVVGTYDTEHIGATCYHNHLSIAENLLSHFMDPSAVVVMDMVAGTDAFASSLFTQFDVLVLQIEPTLRGLQVYHQYMALAEASGVAQRVVVVGNKIRTAEQESFIRESIPEEILLGVLPELSLLQRFDIDAVVPRQDEVFHVYAKMGERVLQTLHRLRLKPREHLNNLQKLHARYASQAHVMRAHGDLSGQIDHDFCMHEQV
ncbi:ATP-binding protein [Candidatus Gracilibacteria bacterium CG17_big_fil_post_rev_8_21_14_2_50_48_13]|nr:MAG: ATP-binding protein [Candidatus Gracilibacteria bacterium CG17_big_fil_post_rev_8_21_14_2_50_48_13]